MMLYFSPFGLSSPIRFNLRSFCRPAHRGKAEKTRRLSAYNAFVKAVMFPGLGKSIVQSPKRFLLVFPCLFGLTMHFLMSLFRFGEISISPDLSLRPMRKP